MEKGVCLNITWIEGQVLICELEGYLGSKTGAHLDDNVCLGSVLDPEPAERVEAIEIDIVQDQTAGEVDELEEWGWCVC